MDDYEAVSLDPDLVDELRARGATDEQIELLDSMSEAGEDISSLLEEFNDSTEDDDEDYGPRVSPRRGGMALTDNSKMVVLEPGSLDDLIGDPLGVEYDLEDDDAEDEPEEEDWDEDDEGAISESHHGAAIIGYTALPAYAAEMDDGVHIYF